MTHIEACLSCSTGNELGFFWDVHNCQPLHSLSQMRASGKGLVYAEKQHLVLAQHPEKQQAVIHYPTKAQPRFRCSMPERMVSVDISPNGVHVAGGGVSGKLYLWQVSSGSLLRIWDGHYKAINSLQFSPDGSFIVSGSEDASVKSWSIAHVLDVTLPASAELRPHHTSSLHTLGVTSVVLGATQGWVATAGKDRTLRVHDFVLNQDLHCCILPSLPKCLAATPQLSSLFAGCADGKIYQTDLYPERLRGKESTQAPQAKLMSALLGHSAANMTASKDASYGQYHSGVFEGHAGGVSALEVTGDSLSLVSGGADGNVHVWQISSKQLLRSFSQHKSPVTALRLVILPSKMPSEKESQRTYPFNPLKKVAITGDNEDDYMCTAYHPSGPVSGSKTKSMFDDTDFGKQREGGRRSKRRRQNREAAAPTPTQEESQPEAKEAEAKEAPSNGSQTAKEAPQAAQGKIIGASDGESLQLIAKLYNIVAVQQQEILALREKAG